MYAEIDWAQSDVVVIDCSAVEFVGRSAYHTFVCADRHAIEHGHRLVIRYLQPNWTLAMRLCDWNNEQAIGPRWSFVDRGLTFGTRTNGGVCVLLREPVPGLVPVGSLRHPGITLTLAEPDRFASSLRRCAGLE